MPRPIASAIAPDTISEVHALTRLWCVATSRRTQQRCRNSLGTTICNYL